MDGQLLDIDFVTSAKLDYMDFMPKANVWDNFAGEHAKHNGGCDEVCALFAGDPTVRMLAVDVHLDHEIRSETKPFFFDFLDPRSQEEGFCRLLNMARDTQGMFS